MRGRYFFVSAKVGDRACNAKHALVRARRQVELISRALQQRPALLVGGAVLFEEFALKTCVLRSATRSVAVRAAKRRAGLACSVS